MFFFSQFKQINDKKSTIESIHLLYCQPFLDYDVNRVEEKVISVESTITYHNSETFEITFTGPQIHCVRFMTDIRKYYKLQLFISFTLIKLFY